MAPARRRKPSLYRSGRELSSRTVSFGNSTARSSQVTPYTPLLSSGLPLLPPPPPSTSTTFAMPSTFFSLPFRVAFVSFASVPGCLGSRSPVKMWLMPWWFVAHCVWLHPCCLFTITWPMLAKEQWRLVFKIRSCLTKRSSLLSQPPTLPTRRYLLLLTPLTDPGLQVYLLLEDLLLHLGCLPVYGMLLVRWQPRPLLPPLPAFYRRVSRPLLLHNHLPSHPTLTLLSPQQNPTNPKQNPHNPLRPKLYASAASRRNTLCATAGTLFGAATAAASVTASSAAKCRSRLLCRLLTVAGRRLQSQSRLRVCLFT